MALEKYQRNLSLDMPPKMPKLPKTAKTAKTAVLMDIDMYRDMDLDLDMKKVVL